jgi:hypothetical protein
MGIANKIDLDREFGGFKMALPALPDFKYVFSVLFLAEV